MSSKPVYAYWNLRGLAGSARNLLHYAGVDYEEKLYELDVHADLSNNSWTAEKFSLGLEFPNLPYWIEPGVEGIKLTESKAILKHIGRKYAPELMPKTDVDVREADMLESLVVDVQTRLIYYAYYAPSEEAGVQMEAAVKPKLEALSKRLTSAARGKWLFGEKLSYVDFLLYEALFFFKAYKGTLLEQFPVLLGYMQSFEGLPGIASYIATEEYKEIALPCISHVFAKQF